MTLSLKTHWSFSSTQALFWNVELCSSILECLRVPPTKSQSSVAEAFPNMWNKKKKKNVLFPDLWNTQSSESSDCAITSNNKSLLASKVASNTECFLFCILSVGWRSSKDGSPQNSKLTAPRRRGNRKGTQINTHRMTKQHSSSMYVGLLLSILSFCLLVLKLRKFFSIVSMLQEVTV